METAPLTFRKYGEDFRQISREGNIAIYERKHGWEVVRLRRRKAYTINGVHYEESERYPGSEEWGENAWTCTTKERAWQRMEQMLEEDRQAEQEAVTLPAGVANLKPETLPRVKTPERHENGSQGQG